MSDKDTCCSIDPYFKIHKGKVREFKELTKKFIAKTEKEKGCLYYGFSFDGNNAYCREGYVDANALIAHVNSVGTLINKALKISDLERLEIHAPKKEIDKMQKPLKDLNPQYFTLASGFRK